MFDNRMTGAVGFAMHEERLARAAKNLHLIEAERARAGRGTHVRGSVSVVVAKGLVALATWIAPSVTSGAVATAQ
jgi:hypothetical protein